MTRLDFQRHSVHVSAKANGLYHWSIRSHTGGHIASGTALTAGGARRRATRLVRRIERA